MNRRLITVLGIVSLLAGGTAALGEAGANELPLPDFMFHLVQRNAEQLWAWSSLETDISGDRSGEPRSDEEWEEAESDALTLQQLTYSLQNASYRSDDPRWDKLIGDLRAAATASANAAERKDFAAFSAAGEDVNARCVACHWAFAPQLETPPPPVPLPRS